MSKERRNSAHRHAALVLLATVIIISGYLSGCESRQPAAATNTVLTETESGRKPVLSEQEQREVVRIFESLAEGHELTQRPEKGPPRGRWSDVPAVAKAAATETEMAILRREEIPDGYIFHLVTIEEWTGELRVERTPGDRIWTATARIGLFNQRGERAEALLDAFEKKMRAMSRKPKFVDNARSPDAPNREQ